MYDPARDIFTENPPSSSPPTESYDLSALDTLAGLAAEAEIASYPAVVKQEKKATPPSAESVSQSAQQPVAENGKGEAVSDETSDGNVADAVIQGGGVEVAGTKEPEMSLKITLHLKKDKSQPKQEQMPDSENAKANATQPQPVTEDAASSHRLDPQSSPKQEDLSPATTAKSPKQPTMSQSQSQSQSQSPKAEPSKETSPKKEDITAEDSRDKDHSYPIPLSLAKLAKIPKRKVEDRHRPEKSDREPINRDQDRDRRTNRRSRSPQRSNRSPPYRPRSPRRLSDDRYRPSPHTHGDSYRPSRDRDDHYVPSKRPRSPSPVRQLKRPVRRDVTAADRERERLQRQQREAERQKADLEAARNRPVYETVRQHYNEREERGREARQESKIFRLRKFNNWIKSVLIAKFIPDRTEEEIEEDRGLFVLDIGCGKGGDLGKWQKQSQVQAYVGVDIADVSVLHAEQRAAELRGRRFSTRFFAMDCFVVLSLSTPAYDRNRSVLAWPQIILFSTSSQCSL